MTSSSVHTSHARHGHSCTRNHPLTLGIGSPSHHSERGSTTGSFRQPVAEIGQMRGLFHRRLLGAHLLRRRAGCLQPENSGPFVLATAPTCILLVPARPGSSLWCSGNQSHRINLTSLIISPLPADRSSASYPIRRATVSPCSEKKNGSGGQRRATVPLALHRPTRPPVRKGQLQSPRLR